MICHTDTVHCHLKYLFFLFFHFCDCWLDGHQQIIALGTINSQFLITRQLLFGLLGWQQKKPNSFCFWCEVYYPVCRGTARCFVLARSEGPKHTKPASGWVYGAIGRGKQSTASTYSRLFLALYSIQMISHEPGYQESSLLKAINAQKPPKEENLSQAPPLECLPPY